MNILIKEFNNDIIIDMKTYILVAVAALGGIFIVLMLVGNKPEMVSVNQDVTTAVSDSVGIKIPTDLPNNVPMYPGAGLDAVTDTASPDERNISLTLVTDASVSDVITWYRGALSEEGWVIVDDKNVGGYILIKAENQNVTIFVQSALREDATTAITERIRIRSTDK